VPSPRNPAQTKTRVWIKRELRGEELYVLCRSEGREAKDRAIREKHEQRLLADVAKLQARVAAGRLQKPEKIYEAIGRLKERYPRVARYHHLSYDPATQRVCVQEDVARKKKAEQVDGAYLLRTDRTDMNEDEIWRLYVLLTRIEDAFRDMKSPLCERPIFHQLQRRVETHIFLCVLAYHLLVVIEKAFLDRGIHTSWHTIRETLRSHQVVSINLPTTNGRILKIRKGGTPEPEHRKIYDVLGIPREVMAPVKLWLPGADSDGKRSQVHMNKGKS
jgi:transposase